jgi:predicted regulator of Ras-like GTPase activity (Roadblock/LC7/MglB family)
MLCSTDGFELASIYKKNPYNSTKLAAVSSSILAMVSAFLNEIHLTGCQSITLDAENGKAILTSIPAPHHPMVMVTLSNKDVLLGQLLYSLKQASAAIVDADQA